MVRYHLLPLLAVLVGVELVPGAANAQDVRSDGLRGLDSVRVVIEVLSDAAKAAGLSESAMQTKVELELRKAGIRISSGRTGPYVYVVANVITAETQTRSLGFVYHVRVELNRYVLHSEDVAVLIIKRGPPEEILSAVPSMDVINLVGKGRFATVWSAALLGITPSDGASADIMGVVVSQLERFMNAYLSVNPHR